MHGAPVLLLTLLHRLLDLLAPQPHLVGALHDERGARGVELGGRARTALVDEPERGPHHVLARDADLEPSSIPRGGHHVGTVSSATDLPARSSPSSVSGSNTSPKGLP